MSPTRRSVRAVRGDAADVGLPAPLAEVLDLLAGESATSRTFLGGVVLGALVGAAVAGATLVRHRGSGQGGGAPRR